MSSRSRGLSARLKNSTTRSSRAGGSASLIPARSRRSSGPSISSARPLSKRFRKIDILVLNAGDLGELGADHGHRAKVWRRTSSTSMSKRTGALSGRSIRCCGRRRGARHRHHVRGRRRDRASLSGAPTPRRRPRLEMLAKTYAIETLSAGVRVAIIDPGPMRTKMRAEAMPGEKPKTLSRPAEIAPVILRASRLLRRGGKYDGEAQPRAARLGDAPQDEGVSCFNIRFLILRSLASARAERRGRSSILCIGIIGSSGSA